jgi:hypothetical protein
MIKIIVTIFLVSAFFILFFNPMFELQNKTDGSKASTTAGFIEDTRDAFIIPTYPAQVMDRDITGKVKSIYGDIGTFVAYSTVPDEHWLSGFPHKDTGVTIDETDEEKLARRVAELESQTTYNEE